MEAIRIQKPVSLLLMTRFYPKECSVATIPFLFSSICTPPSRVEKSTGWDMWDQTAGPSLDVARVVEIILPIAVKLQLVRLFVYCALVITLQIAKLA